MASYYLDTSALGKRYIKGAEALTATSIGGMLNATLE
jgi:hypothetical protein